MNFELLSFPNAAELAANAAQLWLKEIEAAAAPYCVALAGGRITRQFFSAIVSSEKVRHLDTAKIQFFWGDERCVPPTDPESNFGMARELLLAPLGISDNQIHRVRGEEPPEVAATEAEAEVCRIASLDSNGQPILDLIFLGMGEDGHVASLFPGEPETVTRSPAVYRPVTATKPPPRRITLGYPAIATARQVWVLASGAGKEGALRASLGPGSKTPLGRVLRRRQATKILSDIPVDHT